MNFTRRHEDTKGGKSNVQILHIANSGHSLSFAFSSSLRVFVSSCAKKLPRRGNGFYSPGLSAKRDTLGHPTPHTHSHPERVRVGASQHFTRTLSGCDDLLYNGNPGCRATRSTLGYRNHYPCGVIPSGNSQILFASSARRFLSFKPALAGATFATGFSRWFPFISSDASRLQPGFSSPAASRSSREARLKPAGIAVVGFNHQLKLVAKGEPAKAGWTATEIHLKSQIA